MYGVKEGIESDENMLQFPANYLKWLPNYPKRKSYILSVYTGHLCPNSQALVSPD